MICHTKPYHAFYGIESSGLLVMSVKGKKKSGQFDAIRTFGTFGTFHIFTIAVTTSLNSCTISK